MQMEKVLSIAMFGKINQIKKLYFVLTYLNVYAEYAHLKISFNMPPISQCLSMFSTAFVINSKNIIQVKV
jgi:hypothetical protein